MYSFYKYFKKYGTKNFKMINRTQKIVCFEGNKKKKDVLCRGFYLVCRYFLGHYNFHTPLIMSKGESLFFSKLTLKTNVFQLNQMLNRTFICELVYMIMLQNFNELIINKNSYSSYIIDQYNKYLSVTQ